IDNAMFGPKPKRAVLAPMASEVAKVLVEEGMEVEKGAKNDVQPTSSNASVFRNTKKINPKLLILHYYCRVPLTYEFTDFISRAFNVLPSAFLLLQRKNREINKALLSWQGSHKNHFKAKVKLLLEMLVKKYGLEAIKEVMPEEHMNLLTNIRKTKERKERKYAANTEETKSRLSKATTSRWLNFVLKFAQQMESYKNFGDEEADNVNSDDMDTKTFSGRHSFPNSKKSLHRISCMGQKPIN
ncbi:hypothetical protein Tco_1390777, partial [Tanacetum coccineum]